MKGIAVHWWLAVMLSTSLLLLFRRAASYGFPKHVVIPHRLFSNKCTASAPTTSWLIYAGGPTDDMIDHNKNDIYAKALFNGLSKMKVVMARDFFEAPSSKLKQFYVQRVKGVEIKESSIPGAGLGLFATKSIKAGTIVSFYPAHALGMELDDGQEQEELFVSQGQDDQEYFRTHPPTTSSYLHATDQPIFQRPSLLAKIIMDDDDDPPPTTLYLDVNPNRDIVPGWTSHYINDGATVESNDEQGILEYYQKSKATKNCIHIPFGPSPILATVSTRKIKKGQELLTSYGCTYWLGVLYPNDIGATAMTTPIQEQIQDSAQDLFQSLKTVSVIYANQIKALEAAFAKIKV